MRQHASAWALWPTLAVSWVAFAQAVSFQGLAIWVVTGSLLAALVVLPLALAGRRILAVGAMVVMTFAVPVIAEWIGGNTAGPVTRASLMASAAAGAAALILPTRYPVAVLVPSLLLLGGALGLGAAGSAMWLVGLWAVAAAVTVAMLGPYRNPHLRERRRLVPFAAMLAWVGAVAVVALVSAAPFLTDPWTIPGSEQVATPDTTIPPPPPDTTVPPVVPPVTPVTPVEVQDQNLVVSLLVVVVIVLLLLFLLVLILLILWRVVVALLWRRERRRLMRGNREQSTIGAWTWVRLRRARYEQPLPVSASPDVAVAWARTVGDVDVLRVAEVTTPIAFNPDGTVGRIAAKEVWQSAIAAGRRPRGASLRERWRWSGRRPGKVAVALAGPLTTSGSSRA